MERSTSKAYKKMAVPPSKAGLATIMAGGFTTKPKPQQVNILQASQIVDDVIASFILPTSLEAAYTTIDLGGRLTELQVAFEGS